MVKKNKGFTLVELLATIVIIGVLVAVSMPTVLNLLSDNTKKVYVNDAIKLISQAEYKIRAASTNVQKPNNSECIVMSLVFLNNSDFDNPPNKGEYLKEASYVVIKNNGGYLEYSATLVEKMKNGGFRGVKLTSSTELNGKNAKKYVVDFKKSDLVYVDTEELNAGYINNELGKNYVSQIDNKYNYPDLGETVVDEEMMAPHITKAVLSSASGKDYNSLDAQLSISVVDKDTPKSKLKVRYNVVLEGENGTYPDPSSACSNSDDTVSACLDWGSNNNFIKNLDFSKKLSYYDGKTSFTMYLLVIDDDGNYDKKQLTYKVHRNQAPVIEKFAIEKLPSDPGNMPTARVKLSVNDDVDDYSNLLICLTEGTSCKDSDYKTYSSLFNENGYTNYKFMCDNGVCSPDGSTHYLKVFVKDSSGLVASNVDSCKEKKSECEYTFYKNQAPVISTSESDSKLYSKYAKFMGMGEYYCGGAGKTCEAISGNSLDYYFKLKVTDELSDNNNIMLSIQEVDAPKNGKPVANSNPSSISYAEFLNTYQYGGTFSGKYDGKPRYLKIVATDEYGDEDSITLTYGNVHMNQAPVLVKSNIDDKNSKVYSTGCPAKSNLYCSLDNTVDGNVNAKVKLNIVDDIDDANNITITTYDNSYSDTKDSNVTYGTSEYAMSAGKSFKFQAINNKLPYDGKNTKRKYVVEMKDNYGKTSKSSLDYSLYVNKAPVIESVNIKSNSEEFMKKHEFYDGGNSLNATVSIRVSDDLSEDKNIVVKVGEKNKTLSEYKYNSISGSGSPNPKINFSGLYDGENRNYSVNVEDEYDAITKKDYVYTNIYTNKAPIITNYTIESTTKNVCSNTALCPSEDGGNKKAIIKFNVKDDLDDVSNLTYCISTINNEKDCDSYSKYSTALSSTGKGTEYTVVTHYPNNDKPSEQYKQVYLFVRDSYNGKVMETKVNTSTYDSVTYKVYANKPPVIVSGYPTFESSDDDYSVSKIKGTLKVEDDFDNDSSEESIKWKFCYKQKGGKENCSNTSKTIDPNIEKKFSEDLGVASSNYNGQEYELYIKLYDSNGYGITSNVVNYQLYKDIAPVIQKFEMNQSNTELEKVNITIAIEDPFDTYTYCMNDSETVNDNNCTFSTKQITANRLVDSVIQTTETKDLVLPTYKNLPTLSQSIENLNNNVSPDQKDENGNPIIIKTNNINLYLHVKDSHGNITTSGLKELVTCEDDRKTITSTHKYVDYNPTTDPDMDDDINISDYVIGDISANLCGGNCYFIDTSSDGVNANESFGYDRKEYSKKTNRILGFYEYHYLEVDKGFPNNIACSKYDAEASDPISRRCDFHTCFINKKNEYSNKVIGLKKNKVDIEYMYTDTLTGQKYTCTGYYKGYRANYNSSTEEVTLVETNDRYCAEAVDDAKGPFKFNSSAENPYLRTTD